MNPDNIKQSIQAVIDGLAPLAHTLNVRLEHLWKWGMKNNIAQAFSSVLFFVLWVVNGR